MLDIIASQMGPAAKIKLKMLSYSQSRSEGSRGIAQVDVTPHYLQCDQVTHDSSHDDQSAMAQSYESEY